MLPFILKKLAYGFLVLIGVVILVFVLFQGFGDPSRLVMGQTGDAATQAAIRKELYLDQPKWKQFVYYLNDVSPISIYSKEDITKKSLKGLFIGGNTKLAIKLPYLRKSYQTKGAVSTILIEALPGTLLLAITAMFLAVCIGIPLGVLAAVKQGKWQDTSAVFASIVGISAPSFFMAIIVAYLFGFVWTGWTGLHITGSWFDIDSNGVKRLTLQNLILPAFTLGIRAPGDYHAAYPQRHAGCAGPGLYTNGLCKRPEPANGYLEAWPA